MRLSDLISGESGYITKVRGRGAFRRRISEMGFVRGKQIDVIKNAPLKDPIEYKILNYSVSLRRSEADLIEVVKEVEDTEYVEHTLLQIDLKDEERIKSIREKGKVINVALVGNPNAGKTTLFNFASGSSEHTGNYSGVTIDSKTARFKQDGYLFQLTDLPGTYSISAFSPEELYVRDFILNQMPDLVINVVDAANLERNLYLTTQLIDMDVKVILALNMYDELEKRNDELDLRHLSNLLGLPLVPVVSSKGRGINELFQKAVGLYTDTDPTYRHVHINYGYELERSIKEIQQKVKIENNYYITDKISSRFIALKLLENDRHVEEYIQNAENFSQIKETSREEVNRLENLYSDEPASLITDAKYGFIGGALRETYKPGVHKKRELTEILDAFLTHKLFGFPVFIFFLWLMFSATFVLGEIPMQWIENGVAWLSAVINSQMPDGSLKDLLSQGIIGGVGGVIVFLPNILILFFFISFMEDSGYMARTVFIMDKLMHRIGLHGKSFIPLIMGFGCNVPAIMATRTIEDRNNRLITMLINPFMSCSARLPVYLLLIGAIFPDHRGSILFAVYGVGILLAILVALIFKKFVFKNESTPFVMELPPYRLPTLRTSLKHMWNKGSQYLKKMGGVILIASIIMWALGYFPRPHNPAHTQSVITENTVSDISSELTISNQAIEQNLEKTYIGRIGKFIEPVIKPLGFDWKMGVSLISGIAAKEIVVSTLGVLYQSNEAEASSDLSDVIKAQVYQVGPNKGKQIFSPQSTMAFIAFILIYFPCIAVVAAIKRESGSLKWAIFTIVYTTGLAWLVSFFVYQIGMLF